jgi:hypothetical protein
VLEKIAGEHNIQRIILQGPRTATVLLNELYLRMQVLPGGGVKIHGKLLPRGQIVDKFPIAAA